MKIITGNDLRTGRVVYLAPCGSWVSDLPRAAHFENESAEASLDAAMARTTEIAGAYLIEADAAGQPAGREAHREQIRARGPSIVYGGANVSVR